MEIETSRDLFHFHHGEMTCMFSSSDPEKAEKMNFLQLQAKQDESMLISREREFEALLNDQKEELYHRFWIKK